ncbi:epithelial zinc-finger EZF protein [Colletotrichum tofieldiae]|uniref:Epithelial zinc-finger EZF protein n=1 Tax=Colletotrichum tofieldiae TaxID=708197 RepID=A0A166MVY7_9PEZI|nr:epithelial zinc-finger EZF protein [Colletotrichum tofieldiae]
MDLTPPSLTRSPASPAHTYCPSERSSSDYPSPDLAAQQYKITSLYAAGQLCSAGLAADADISLPPLDPRTTADWAPSNVMAPSSSSFSIPNVLSEYDQFADYDPPMPASYGSEAFPPPHSHSSGPGHHAHSLTDSPGRSPGPTSSRSSFSYAQSGHASSSLGPRIKMENVNDYGSGIDASHYASPRSMQAPYMVDSGPYGSSHQHYLSDTQSPSWSKVEYGAEHYYQNSPAGEPAPPSQEAKRAEDLKHNRPKRAPRKMTSFADAQYQCQVKGCGKLFSRSYNYKAHLDTHDEKREYPFPCPIADCNKRFVRKTDLQRHNQSVHMKEKNHRCDYCGRLFARKDTLRRHMEDGCSKRFDVGTCDLRVDGYEGMGSINRSMGAPMHPMGSGSGPLPPITMSMGSGGGLLHPESSASRGRSIMSGTSDGPLGDSWQR